MIKFKNYYQPDTLEEAYQLSQKKKHVVLGGMLWLKLSNHTYTGVIDLKKLGLDQITEEEDCFSIGAMVTLRMLEKHEGLNAYSKDACKHAVEHIIGVQFRNLATVGGTVFGRYGFSDVLPVFLAMDASVELYHGGIVPLREFITRSRREKDILVRVIVPKNKKTMAYQAHRDSATDFPTVTAAVSVGDDKRICCVVGGRPELAVVYEDAGVFPAEGMTKEFAKSIASRIAETTTFRSNIKASAAYRRKLCEVLLTRALMECREKEV